MSTMTKALARSRSVVETAYNAALTKAGPTIDLSPPSGMAQFGQFRDDTKNRERYSLFRGWLYAAINALAAEAAGQPVVVAKLKGTGETPKANKALTVSKMTSGARNKAASQEFEILVEHPLIGILDEPNTIQTRWSFVYGFVANLNLTGFGYIVGGENEEGNFEFYSLPTTWVRPNHEEGPFSRFKVVDPANPTAGNDDEWLTRENVAFAMLPSPADPRVAYPPAQSQMPAIRIDDFIQSSQAQFFDNGIFPGAIVTIGKDPHPEVSGEGKRPRLTAAQRRQVIGAIRKVMGGVANYGNPAIVDGLIEKIERLSMTSNEMGWEKSEDKVRTRILSAFGVHPYILGEPVGVGGYAQVANIEKRFYKRVNTFLDMLGTVVSNFIAPAVGKEGENTLAWWEECQAVDPGLRWSNLQTARRNGDVSRNEIRAELGLPPDETGGDQTKNYSAGDVNAIVALQGAVSKGVVEPQQAAEIYMVAFDMDAKTAKKVAGKKPPPQPAPGGGVPEQSPGQGPPATEEEATQQATRALDMAVKSLGLSVSGSALPAAVADRLIEMAEE